MGDVGVRVTVDDTRLQRGVDGLIRDLGAPGALDEIAAAGAALAATEAPRRTGRLAGGNRGRRVGRTTAEIDNPVPYSGYVNHGTALTPANPFADRATQQLEPAAVRLLETDIDTSIRKRGLA